MGVSRTYREGQDKAWWEVDAIVSGFYDGNTFVRRVLDHMSSQDEPIGGNPPTYGDLFQCKTRDGPLGYLGRPPDPKSRGNTTPQVSSVVQVPGKAKAESDECPKVQALRARLKQKYGETFFSGKPVFPPPVRGPYGEAKIRLKPDPRVYRHRDFALRGERKEAMEQILPEFIERGWLEPCHSEWASPSFYISKKVAGEWRLLVDYRGLNAQTQHDSYTLPLIEDMLQKQDRRRIFTVIDLTHGYHQIPLADESRACTAMSTPLGPLQWKVMPSDLPYRSEDGDRIQKILNFFDTVAREWGLDFNLSKTEIHAMGTAPPRTFTSPSGTPLSTTNQKTGLPHDCYKYLGVYIFTTNHAAQTLAFAKSKIRSFFTTLQPLRLTLSEYILLVNVQLIPILSYPLMAHPSALNELGIFQAMIWQNIAHDPSPEKANRISDSSLLRPATPPATSGAWDSAVSLFPFAWPW